MKILIIQLARLGDILMTWPQVRALKQKFPDAQIDMLVRPRFKAATHGLDELHEVIEFPVENIFEPLFDEPLKVDQSLSALESIIDRLKANKYTWIVNSTLSPASSYLTHALQESDIKVSGYSRTSDGFLAIADDVSAYIYAQVGVDRDNRIHLSDLFTLMVDIQPSKEHWKTTVKSANPIDLTHYVVVHVGASRDDKKFSPFKWRTFITHFQKLTNLPVILIGNAEETKDSSFISLGFDTSAVLDYTGKLLFQDLFPLIANAQLYIGCDSAPLHIASLVGTPSLNISLKTVNFWETGPKAEHSRVLYAESEADLPSEMVAVEAMSIINKEPPQPETISVIDTSPSYKAPANTRNKDWVWNSIYALYMGGSWPALDSNTLRQGLKNLGDVNRVIIEQFETIHKTRNVSLVSGIIERCEEVIDSVGQLVPELRPFIRWYQTQKSLIGPGKPATILEATEKVHQDFDSIIQFWLSADSQPTEDLNGSP